LQRHGGHPRGREFALLSLPHGQSKALRGSPPAHALINRACALINLDRFEEARATAREDWPRAQRIDLLGVWTDVLSLLLARDAHSLAAACLLASRRASIQGRPLWRQVNEERTVVEAEQIVRRALGDEATDAVLHSGVVLSAREILALVVEGDRPLPSQGDAEHS
jgi:hypothetical protein